MKYNVHTKDKFTMHINLFFFKRDRFKFGVIVKPQANLLQMHTI